jgi:hypothetical protein
MDIESAFNVISGIVGTILLGLFGRFLYGVVFGKVDEQVRSALIKASSLRKRRALVEAFVSGANGSYLWHERRIYSMLALMLLLAVTVPGLNVMLSISRWNSDTREKAMEAISVADSLLADTSGKSAPEKTIQQRRKDVLAAREKLVRLNNERDERSRNMYLFIQSITIFTALCYIYVTTSISTAVVRRTFAREIEQFTLRIQGLASKQELAELAVAEMRVSDEETLKAFIEAAKRIAERHCVPKLVTRFDLWSPPQR